VAITVPLWVWTVSLAGAAGTLVAFLATLPSQRRPDVGAGVVLGVTLVAVLAANGVFQNRASAVPWIGPVLLLALVLWLTVLRSATVADLPALTRLNAFLVVGWVFIGLWLGGTLPPQFALPAGLGDIAIGLAAPAVAARLRRGDTRGARRFHLLGILDLIVAIGTAFLSAPGPYQVFNGAVTTAAITALPLILIPAVLVPLYLAIHLVALRNLRDVRRRVDVARPDPARA
jgi:hypothetical protein